jgi:hypothetical protein
MAAPIRWDKESKDDPDGILYVSNKHLIFEQKENAAMKKVLCITTASELVQRILINQPKSGVKSKKAANNGFFAHHDFLRVRFSDTKLEAARFHHSQAGDYTKDHTVPLEKIELERLWKSPQPCSNSGTVLVGPIIPG